LGVGVLPVCTSEAQQTPWCHWPVPAPPLVVRVLQPTVLVTTMLVRRRSRSLRPCAQAAWTQFVADGARGGAASAASSLPARVCEQEAYAQSDDRMTGT
jgi:hypothetical protein